MGEGTVRDSWAEEEEEIFRNKRREKQERCKNCPKTVRCTLLNGSACTERKCMRRYQKYFRHFFGIEHRMRRERRWRSSLTRNPTTDEGLQLARQGSSTRMQAARIANTRREESL